MLDIKRKIIENKTFREVLKNKELFRKITIILFIFCLCFSSILMKQSQKDYYTFGTIKIEKQQLRDLSNAVNSNTVNSVPFLLCEFDSGDCVRIMEVRE